MWATRITPRRCSIAVGALFALAAAGCTSGESLDATTALPALGVELDHPADLVLQEETEAGATFCFEPVEVRAPRCLSVSPREGSELSVSRGSQQSLDGGAHLFYDLSTVNGGSGGPEHRLDGYVSLDLEDSAGVNVSATAPGDAGFDDATWSLAVIETIRELP